MICLCQLYFYHNRSLKKFFPFLALIVIVAVTNPLFVQRGRTILYADTHIRITKEALLYGIHYGCVLAVSYTHLDVYKRQEFDTRVKDTLKITEFLEDVMEQIKNYFHLEIDTQSLSYERFITHLKFLSRKLFASERMDDMNNDVQEMIQKICPEE